MAHELTTDSRTGKVQFMYAGKVPWHGLGQSVGEEVTAGEAIVHAGLDYEYQKESLLLPFKSEEQPAVEVPFAYAVTRDYDRHPVGVVGSDYRIIQPKECFDFMDQLVGEGQAKYHTAGSIFNGKIIFMTMKLPEDIRVGDDNIEQWLFCANPYDGSGSLYVMLTPVRVVCANTYSLAFGRNHSNKVRVRHTSNYQDKLIEARNVLGTANSYYANFAEQCEKLLNQKFAEGDFVRFAEELVPGTLQEDGTIKVAKKTRETRSLLLDLFYNGPGQKPVAETKWAALNAVTDYVDHHAPVQLRDKTPMEARINSAFYGGGQTLRQNALDLLTV